MRVDFSRALLGLDGKPLQANSKDLTLGTACIEALMGQLPDEQETGEEKLARFLLAERIYAGGIQNIKAKEIETLKERIGRGYGPAVIGPAYRMLDGEDQEDTQPGVAARGD